MKAIGIVRKIDDLGRVVIPKEIRRVNGWDEGQLMEFFVEGNALVLKEYQGEKSMDEAFANLTYLESTITDPAALEKLAEVKQYVMGAR